MLDNRSYDALSHPPASLQLPPNKYWTRLSLTSKVEKKRFTETMAAPQPPSLELPQIQAPTEDTALLTEAARARLSKMSSENDALRDITRQSYDPFGRPVEEKADEDSMLAHRRQYRFWRLGYHKGAVTTSAGPGVPLRTQMEPRVMQQVSAWDKPPSDVAWRWRYILLG